MRYSSAATTTVSETYFSILAWNAISTSVPISSWPFRPLPSRDAYPRIELLDKECSLAPIAPPRIEHNRCQAIDTSIREHIEAGVGRSPKRV